MTATIIPFRRRSAPADRARLARILDLALRIRALRIWIDRSVA